MQEPFLISPLMRDQEDWLRWYDGRTPTRVKALRIVAEGHGPSSGLNLVARVRLFNWEGPRHPETPEVH